MRVVLWGASVATDRLGTKSLVVVDETVEKAVGNRHILGETFTVLWTALRAKKDLEIASQKPLRRTESRARNLSRHQPR
jgi:hypothetical protein